MCLLGCRALAAVLAATLMARAADWHVAALDRIDKIRKAEFRVEVKDAAGRPVPGASVSVRMRRHAFGFGTAVAAEQLLGDSGDSHAYRAQIERLFNKAVLENDLKWPQWEQNRQRAVNAIAWLNQRHMAVRGHNLVWPGWRWLPRDLGTLLTPVTLRDRVRRHITEEVTALRGLVTEWDVINEPYTNRDLQRILGDAEMAEWYRLARAADPGAKLFLNDFHILAAGGTDTAHQDALYSTLQYLYDQGAPVDGIGLQSHFDDRLTPPARVIAILDRFSGMSPDIEITEFDINIDDEQLQADYTRDFLTAVFSHPAVKGFLMWGFWEGRHWRPKAAMFRRDWSLKPNGKLYEDLVLHQWWTNADGITDEAGVYRTRGFLGDYEITASAGVRTGTARATLNAGGARVGILLR